MSDNNDSPKTTTPCGHQPNDADCGFCLKMKEYREMRKNAVQPNHQKIQDIITLCEFNFGLLGKLVASVAAKVYLKYKNYGEDNVR